MGSHAELLQPIQHREHEGQYDRHARYTGLVLYFIILCDLLGLGRLP